jgi:hypothetical protein
MSEINTKDTTERVKAIEFAEWISLNQWFKRFATHPKYVGKYWSDFYSQFKTIEELYDMFLEEQGGKE